ncbi:hypothetical protein [Streptomyces mirabilis]|uniref:hypothetical protein n=1 Tax=Streptomyces mirabilis TaxID=68239 RepID=UPI0036C3A5B8
MDGWEVYEDDPRTDTGARTIALDSDTVQALMRHRAQQDEDREEWGSAWAESVRVFTKKNGEMLPPPTSPGGSSSWTRRSASVRSGSTARQRRFTQPVPT